jgi:hypothetical protein
MGDPKKASNDLAAEDLARIAEPSVFLVDDVAFVPLWEGRAS